MFIRAIVCAALLIPAAARAYDLHNLTPADILVIGRGLDELPRKDTDRNNLYGRIQADLTAQDQAAAKAAIDKANADKAPAQPKED